MQYASDAEKATSAGGDDAAAKATGFQKSELFALQ
jgi:hypothetical protein